MASYITLIVSAHNQIRECGGNGRGKMGIGRIFPFSRTIQRTLLGRYMKRILSRQLCPRLKRATPAVTTEDDRVRPIDTIPLKACNISFLPL